MDLLPSGVGICFLGSQDRNIANVISLCENRILRFRMAEKYILGAHDYVLFQFKKFKFQNHFHRPSFLQYIQKSDYQSKELTVNIAIHVTQINRDGSNFDPFFFFFFFINQTIYCINKTIFKKYFGCWLAYLLTLPHFAGDSRF